MANSNSSLYSLGNGTTSSSSFPGNALVMDRSPTSFDIRGPNGAFSVGQLWVNKTLGSSFQLVGFSSSNGFVMANWITTASATGALNTLSGNTGTATPSAGNIAIEGEDLYNVTGSGSTLTISPTISAYPFTPFTVGPVGSAGYQTIQSAIDACYAAGGGCVVIQKGVYVEDLTLRAGVDFMGVTANCDTDIVHIIGTHTPHVEAGTVQIQLVNFYSTTGHIFYSTAAGQGYLGCSTTNFILLDTDGWIFDMPNWTGPLSPLVPTGFSAIGCDNCGDLSQVDSGFINNPNGQAFVAILFSYVGSQQGAVGTKQLITSGVAQFSECDIFCPVNITGNTQTVGNANYFETTNFHGSGVILSGDSTGYITTTGFDGLTTQSAITMSSSGDWYVSATSIDTTAVNAIDGAGSGSLNLSGVSFSKSSGIAGTVTLGTGSSFVTGEVSVNGDVGGKAGFTSLTAANSTTISTGVGSVRMSSANPATNTAWIKIYIGTTAYWIPAWTTNSP